MITLVFPGLIVGFREGMEAFLIIGIMLQYLNKINRQQLKKYVKAGLYAGIAGSFLIGLVLLGISFLMGKADSAVSKLWESIASFVALVFISSFIYWMIKNGKNMVKDVQSEVSRNLSAVGLFTLSAVMVLREGAEIALFAFTASETPVYMTGVLAGILLAAILAFFIYRSLIKINLALILSITLAYLIFQAGYMLGYSIHEFLAVLKTLGKLDKASPWLVQLYNLAGTVLDHKTGILGIPLNILLGWYSKPEVIQFILQSAYVLSNFLFWRISWKSKTADPVGK